MHRNKALGCVPAMAVAVLWLTSPAQADTILWIDDGNGNIGQVDINTQSVVASSVHSTGLGGNLTDIGFGTNGTLYGTTYAGLYSINTSTGTPTFIGNYTVGNDGMVALVGSGSPGTLLGASIVTTQVYSISQANASATNFEAAPLPSAGDLALAGQPLYESAINTNGDDALVNVTTGAIVGDFNRGATRFGTVLGLADDGTTMYAVDGTEVYSVNLANAALTPLFNYALAENGQDLAGGFGTAFIGEGAPPPPPPVPEPASILMFGCGLLGLGFLARRKRR
jgi:hypothetical protein